MAIPPPPLQTVPVVRETRGVRIDGVQERWRLVWRGVPDDRGACGPADPGATTCPCTGFAYAQVGDLVLERARPGRPVERMRLSPLFAGSQMVAGKGRRAMLARWPSRLRDIEHPPTPAAIRARRPVPIMRLRDYDHDGVAGEFLLQIDTLTCGKQAKVAIGVGGTGSRLHVLTSVDHPERPLALLQHEWAALARRSRPGEVMDIACGDHGSEEEARLRLSAIGGRIRAIRITRTCPDTVDGTGAWHHDARFRQRIIGRKLL